VDLPAERESSAMVGEPPRATQEYARGGAAIGKKIRNRERCSAARTPGFEGASRTGPSPTSTNRRPASWEGRRSGPGRGPIWIETLSKPQEPCVDEYGDPASSPIRYREPGWSAVRNDRNRVGSTLFVINTRFFGRSALQRSSDRRDDVVRLGR